MRTDSTLFRLAALAAIAGLASTAAPLRAYAQAPTENPAPDQQEVNPSARVGALTELVGTVSFHAPGADSWSAATLNYPITPGEGVWTQPGAEARIGISDTRIVLNQSSELEVSTLDDRSFVATLPQGEAYVRVRSLLPNETYTLVTPRGAVTIGTPGRYDVMSGDTNTPTRITVLEGAAALSQGVDAQLTAGQAAEITGDQAPFQMQVVAATRSPFVDHVLAEERPPPAQAAPPPPVVAQMPGGEDLDQYGSWAQAPDYGEVWYPQVPSGWVPYREGHWAWVDPWGWTWVDNDPWGFAPFHYGRWVEVGHRWAWTPGLSTPVPEAPPYPVYAPALVAFFGVAAGAAVTAAMLSRGSVGWVPLGPREPYHPWFHAAPNYVRNVNIRNVTNINQINNTTINNVTMNHFRNAGAATVVPAAAMATSQPVQGFARPVSPQVLGQARPVFGRSPVAPTTATVGVTPGVARTIGAVPPPAGVVVPHRPPAPGPAIRTAQQGVPPGLGRPAAGGGPPGGLHPGAPSPAIAHPGPAPSEPHAAAGVPALRPPGAVPPAPPIEAGAAAPLHPPTTPAPHAAATPGAPRAPAEQRPAALAVPHPGPAPHEPATPAVVQPAVPHPIAPQIETHHAPGPAPVPHPAAPAAPVHAAPAPVQHPAAPPVTFHPAPAAEPHPAPPPAAAFHPAPAPVPHPAPPPPVAAFHPAPAPAPHPMPPIAARPAEPAPHLAPPPAPHPAAAPHPGKRPGEP